MHERNSLRTSKSMGEVEGNKTVVLVTGTQISVSKKETLKNADESVDHEKCLNLLEL